MVIRTIDSRSYLVKTSPKNLVASRQLKTIAKEQVELRVIMSANAKLITLINAARMMQLRPQIYSHVIM